MNFLFLLAASLTLFSSSSASQNCVENDKPTVTTVFQFPNNGTWIENIAVRPNGELLLSRVDVPELWSLDPNKGSASLLYNFSDAASLLGITEITPDVFAVASLRLDLTTRIPIANTSIIWKVDFSANSTIPTVSTIVAARQLLMPNGLATFDSRSEQILIADTGLTKTYLLDTRTGALSLALKDETMTPAPNASNPVGVNGVKVSSAVALA